jgi:hypothetical protein
MSTAAVSCPYCNSPAVVPAGTSDGQRVPCPRCGESFPYRGPTVIDHEAPTDVSPRAPAPAPAIQLRPANWVVGVIVLGMMVSMALVGLAFALQTEGVRRAHDLRLPKSRAIDIPFYALLALGIYIAGLVTAFLWGWNRRDRAPELVARPWTRRLSAPALVALAVIPVVVLAALAIRGRSGRQPLGDDLPPAVVRVPPAELPALGYVPSDVNVVVGLHVAEALDDPSGKELLKGLSVGDLGTDLVQQWTGLPLAELDHAALGLRLEGELIPRLTLVARTRQPYKPEKVRESLKAQRTPEPGHKRPVYRFKTETGSVLDALPAYVWFADDRTLVVHLSRRWEVVPEEPKDGLDHLPAPLAQYLRQRAGRDAQVWAVGHLDDWEKAGGLALLRAGPLKEAWDTLSAVRTAGVSVRCGDGLTLTAAFDCADEAAAKALARSLEPGEGKALNALGLDADAGPIGRDFLKTLKVAREGTWVDLQAKASAEAVQTVDPGKAR